MGITDLRKGLINISETFIHKLFHTNLRYLVDIYNCKISIGDKFHFTAILKRWISKALPGHPQASKMESFAKLSNLHTGGTGHHISFVIS